MASVERLLAALRDRAQEFLLWQSASSICPLDAWGLVARNAARVLDLVDGPTELGPILRHVGVAVVDDLSNGHESPLTAVGLTMGVLADTLESRPDVVGTASLIDRSHVRSAILASLHATAQTSAVRAAPPEQHPTARHILTDLADATEAASHVPPRPLEGALSALSIGPARGSLEDAMTHWAVTASETLSSPTRATKYAFQRTAASIARICWTGANAPACDDACDRKVRDVRGSLLAAFQSWQSAAAWPTELRLDGRSGGLRQSSQHLEQALAGWHFRTRPGSLMELESVVQIASEVGAVLEVGLRKRVASGGLWITAQALGPSYLTRHPGTNRGSWLPDPGSPYGAGLLRAAERANLDLGLAIRQLRPPFLNHRDDGVLKSGVWERVTPHHNGHVEQPHPGTPSTHSIECLGARFHRHPQP